MSLERLKDIGLTEREMAALSWIFYDGLTLREAGKRMSLSQVQVMRLRDSGLAKIRAKGLPIDKLSEVAAPKTRPMDPAKMAGFTEDQNYTKQ